MVRCSCKLLLVFQFCSWNVLDICSVNDMIWYVLTSYYNVKVDCDTSPQFKREKSLKGTGSIIPSKQWSNELMKIINMYVKNNRQVRYPETKITDFKMSGTRFGTSHHHGRLFLEMGTKQEWKCRFHYLWLGLVHRVFWIYAFWESSYEIC